MELLMAWVSGHHLPRPQPAQTATNTNATDGQGGEDPSQQMAPSESEAGALEGPKAEAGAALQVGDEGVEGGLADEEEQIMEEDGHGDMMMMLVMIGAGLCRGSRHWPRFT
jgi:hypothetical protein